MNSLNFEKVINYNFKDKELLVRALTHSSHVKSNVARAVHNNERLEFLGDAFFDAIISDELCMRMPNAEEGLLTKVRAKVVCEKSLAMHGNRLKIGEYMRMGKGEAEHGGKTKPSIVADAMEAVIGAIFKDGGYYAAREFVISVFNESIELAIAGKLFVDYKTEIQEKLSKKMGNLEYVVVDETGPDHSKTFFVQLRFNEKEIGSGIGRTKKEAENMAAKKALEAIAAERGEKLVL